MRVRTKAFLVDNADITCALMPVLPAFAVFFFIVFSLILTYGLIGYLLSVAFTTSLGALWFLHDYLRKTDPRAKANTATFGS